MQIKKHLGQHFFINEPLLENILNKYNFKNKNILEVGPGRGALTKILLKKKFKTLTLLEIDPDMNEKLFLLDQFNRVKLINKSCLNHPISTDILISNLPYNISSKFLIKLLTLDSFQECILLLQEDFVRRIMKLDNFLGFFIHLTCYIKKIQKVSPACFFPKPRVLSAFVYIKYENNFNIINKVKAINMLKLIFCHKNRKLKSILPHVPQKFANLRGSKINLNNFRALLEHYQLSTP